MESLYLFCAVFGCAFVLGQLCLSFLFGLGMDTGDGSVDSDFSGEAGGGDLGDTGDAADGDVSGVEHGASFSPLLFVKMLSVRTITAGLGFFGLAGLAGEAADLSDGLTFLVALAAGLVSFVLVYFAYRLLNAFHYNGAISQASLPGCSGTVHVRVPARRSGYGKVIVTQQERSMEYDAITDATDLLPAGTPVVVAEVLNSSLIRVSVAEENDKNKTF
ncbi:MAG: hypothetical protein Q4G68_05420 [Planctomycetia bacterium]|nr:hypothetical protein [Planctomycetia bacterium]